MNGKDYNIFLEKVQEALDEKVENIERYCKSIRRIYLGERRTQSLLFPKELNDRMINEIYE
jgi:hypothetical protein